MQRDCNEPTRDQPICARGKVKAFFCRFLSSLGLLFQGRISMGLPLIDQGFQWRGQEASPSHPWDPTAEIQGMTRSDRKEKPSGWTLDPDWVNEGRYPSSAADLPLDSYQGHQGHGTNLAFNRMKWNWKCMEIQEEMTGGSTIGPWYVLWRQWQLICIRDIQGGYWCYGHSFSPPDRRYWWLPYRVRWNSNPTVKQHRWENLRRLKQPNHTRNNNQQAKLINTVRWVINQGSIGALAPMVDVQLAPVDTSRTS